MNYRKSERWILIGVFAAALIVDFLTKTLRWFDIIFAISILLLGITAYAENKKRK